jgi:hypothetical protein
MNSSKSVDTFFVMIMFHLSYADISNQSGGKKSCYDTPTQQIIVYKISQLFVISCIIYHEHQHLLRRIVNKQYQTKPYITLSKMSNIEKFKLWILHQNC